MREPEFFLITMEENYIMYKQDYTMYLLDT